VGLALFQFSQERLEKRVKELNRQLLEEKQNNRRDKLTVVRLQREIARQKSDGPLVSAGSTAHGLCGTCLHK